MVYDSSSSSGIARPQPQVVQPARLGAGDGNSSLGGRLVIHKGFSTLLSVWYSVVHALLLLLLVRTMGKPALTSCS